jgi:hypothetical protein
MARDRGREIVEAVKQWYAQRIGFVFACAELLDGCLGKQLCRAHTGNAGTVQAQGQVIGLKDDDQ